jgi:hypothetical protein
MNGQQLTTAQQLQVRRSAARHLRGIPARQNAATIAELETLLLLEEAESRSTPEERARWEREEQSLGLI